MARKKKNLKKEELVKKIKKQLIKRKKRKINLHQILVLELHLLVLAVVCLIAVAQVVQVQKKKFEEIVGKSIYLVSVEGFVKTKLMMKNFS